MNRTPAARAPHRVGRRTLRHPRAELEDAEQVMGSVEPPRTEFEVRAERLGKALRGLAAELVDERRKVVQLRREVAVLRARLAALERD